MVSCVPFLPSRRLGLESCVRGFDPLAVDLVDGGPIFGMHRGNGYGNGRGLRTFLRREHNQELEFFADVEEVMFYLRG